MFQLSGVSFSYGKRRILENIDLEIRKGSFLSIIGPNGSGKSTLLSIITGLRKPAAGDVFFENRKLSSYSSSELAKRRSFCSSFHGDLPEFTVREYIRQRSLSAGSFLSQDFGKSSSNFRYAVETTGISHKLDAKITALSAGEFQLAAIAAAVAQSREIIILDEPAEHLDIKHSREIYGLLGKLHREGSTIITVLHDINAALNLSDHIVAVKEGFVAFSGSPERFIRENTADTIFDIPFQCRPHPLSGKACLFTE
jgi:iron complex transport system ATP-binding protein